MHTLAVHKQRLAAIDHVAATFLPAEIATDTAALEVSRSVTAIMEARQDANLPLATGLQALSRLAKASALIIEAREEIIRAHGLLDKVPAAIGVPVHAYGKDVPPEAFGGGMTPVALDQPIAA